MINKKGNIKEVVSTWIGVFSLGFVLVLCFILAQNFNTSLQDNPASTNNTVVSLQKFEDKYQWDDKAVLIYYLVLLLVTGILTYSIRYSKYYFAFCFVILILSALFGALVEDLWAGFVSVSTISSSLTTFTVTNYLLTHPVLFIFFQLIIMLSIQYYKTISGD